MRVVGLFFSVFAFCAVAYDFIGVEKTLPKMSPAKYMETYHEYRVNMASGYSAADRSPGAPGYGYSGTIQPYKDTPGLRENREYYNLSAGWFVRDPLPPGSVEARLIAYEDSTGRRKPFPDRLPFLLFTPDAKRGGEPVPLVVFMPGNGELGNDLNRQFRQSLIFERVTSQAFQAKHPCYLLVPSVPPDSPALWEGATDCRPSDIENLLNDTILGVALAQQNPPVDTNRLYATGLSYGGAAVYGFGCSYPGRYAALVPVAACPPGEIAVHPTRPGNWWLFCNEGVELTKKSYMEMVNAFKRRVTLQGGEFRVSTFPEKGHNAWDRAWREEVVWDWMFSKTADGRGANPRPDTSTPFQKGANPRPDTATPSPLSKGGGREADGGLQKAATYTASVKGEDEKTGPERGGDGLMSTAYVSARGLKAGEYWQAEFAGPVAGRVSLTLGNTSGMGAPRKAKVEVSAEGKSWTTVLRLDKGSASESFTLTRPARFIRITSTAPANATEVLIVRNLVVE